MSDLISRHDAIDDIRTMNPKNAQLDIKWVEMWLKQLPSAEPERKKGKWVVVDTGIYTAFECDQCGFIGIGINSLSNFCPCCGADMRGEQDE